MAVCVRGLAVIAVYLSCASVATAGQLTQEDLDAGVVPQPGDTVILREFSRLTPPAALSLTSTRGTWWLRPYREKQGGPERVMLLTVERDMDRPEACLVPRVTYPLSLSGWYEVWIGTYRGTFQGPYGGGIDVKLSGDDSFLHINPQQVPAHAGRPKPPIGVIVEVNYKPAVDLTGQSLEFQQPYGSYESFHWGFCEAYLAYIRLVRLSDAQVAAFQADQADSTRRRIAVDDDNFSRYWMWGGEGIDKILRIYEPFRYADVLFHGLCLGESAYLAVPTPYSDVMISDGDRLGDQRIRTMYTGLVAKGIDLLQVATERAHKYGVKLLPTMRLTCGCSSATYQEMLPRYRLKACGGMDFAYAEVRDYHVKIVRYILEHYDVDGFILDFTRHSVYFNADAPNKTEHMNAFCAQMRAMVDDVRAQKGKELWLVATFSDASYSTGWTEYYLKVKVRPDEVLAYTGIDAAAWVKNGYFDIIMPEGPNLARYITMTRGTSTRCFPRWEYHSTVDCEAVAAGVHDPVAGEDKQDRPQNPHNGPCDFEAGWLQLHEQGADGLYLFNCESGWNTLSRMGHIAELRARVASGSVYGLVEGPAIEFTASK